MSGVHLLLIAGGGMTASATPTSAGGIASGFPPTALTVTTNTVSVTVQGGLGPFTYAWSKVSGDTVTVTAPTSNLTAFTETQPPGTFFQAIYRCTATSAGGITASVDVPITLNFVNLA